MSQQAIYEVLRDITLADSMSYWIVAGLTALLFVIMRSMLPVKALSFLLAPGIFWGGLAGIYAMSTLGFAFARDKASNTLVSATVGMVVALVVMFTILRLVEVAMRRSPLKRAASETYAEPRRVRI